MTLEEERQLAQAEQQKLTEAYKMTFFGQAYGDTVLMDLLNDLGFFATDPECVKPELIAAANRILMKAGVYNTGFGLQRYIDGMRKAAKGE